MKDVERPMTLADDRVVVPGNRWDLVDSSMFRDVSVAVVIPHYEQPTQLALVLRALELQRYRKELIEVVVADDGSSTEPDVSWSGLCVSVVRQADLGFRAAAARNLGAAATSAELICFLDADTVPEPTYLRRLTRLASVLPDAVSVGRRRHADLSGWAPEMLSDWWSGRTSPPILREPRWLMEAYAASADLLHADSRSYRHVISAVMCCSRELFEDIGGFDESFREYGGEDWEFAHRAQVNGAVLHHARDAVAWHDGPDWADRNVGDRVVVKNREALALARLIPDPAARRAGLHHTIPRVVVDVDSDAHSAASLVTTVSCFLHEDVGIWLRGARAGHLLTELGMDDSRIHTGPVPDVVARRSQLWVTTVGRPRLPREAFSDLLSRCSQEGVGRVRCRDGSSGLTIDAAWAVNRRRRWADRLSASDAQLLAGVVDVAAESVDLGTVARDVDLSW